MLKTALKTRGSKERAEKEIERKKKIITERAELERNDKPNDNEGKLCKQEGLNKYEQKTGLKRSSGKISSMVAKEEDLDPFKQAYEVMAKEGPANMTIGTKTSTLHMATKQERANRGMLTQEESKIQEL